MTLAYDLAVTLNDSDNFRVLPVAGEGGGQNIRDILHLKGVDLGITAINVLNKLHTDGQLGIGDEKIVYITELGNDVMHVLVRADSGIASLQQLDGKKVNLNSAGSATETAAYEIFDRLGIKPIGSNMGQADAYARLSRGDIAATFQLGGNPAPAVAGLRARDGFRLLSVPYDLRLPQEYLPATLTGDDYPALIPVGEHIDTLAVGTLMIAYNWPKNTDGYRRIAEFVDRFFSRFAALQRPPRYPAWRELNLAATLPTWKRFPEAQAWLNSRRPPALGGTPGTRN